ncbi:beta-1,4-N-acetylgalactosaminyltransferase bre-4-like [Mercenaria mercenaria]|uniref:beta-1,4-N-acetylgalactosaminyltransferase bre-4-like n=1 Tax=Mercenaria mercenaria TaxID=6596 RepID=UPI00234F656F|nr:beta-1,4-N-acetylgalactosaminyltransferase bre-4-like [Mercenaria mercenaria]
MEYKTSLNVTTWSTTPTRRFVQACLLLILLLLLYCGGYLVHEKLTISNIQRKEESCLWTTHIGFNGEDGEKLIPGGRYKPLDCESKNPVAVIVPYRNREAHLKIFLNRMHPFLQRQELDYGIFVVEMLPGVKFNRALLMNIGFVESRRQYGYQCFIFHDVDLLPENDHIRYTCSSSPTHLSAAIDSKNYTMPYKTYFGGVCAISKEHFEKINGYSNIYFDWGGEDDDLFERIKFSELKITRLPDTLGRYKMLSHPNAKQNPDKNILFKTMKERYHSDGLNSLKYRLVKYELKQLYTWILVSINETEVMENEPIHKGSY